MLSTFWSQLWVKAGISFPLRIPRLTDGDKELVLLSSAHCRVLHITRGRHSMFSTTHSTMVYVTHVERRPPVSGRACSPACHPERSEGSRSPDVEILRCAQDDRPSLHMSDSDRFLAHRVVQSARRANKRSSTCDILFSVIVRKKNINVQREALPA